MKRKIIKTSKKTENTKKSSSVSSSNFFTILDYCGYRLEGKKIVSSGKYNPVPYKGI